MRGTTATNQAAGITRVNPLVMTHQAVNGRAARGAHKEEAAAGTIIHNLIVRETHYVCGKALLLMVGATRKGAGIILLIPLVQMLQVETVTGLEVIVRTRTAGITGIKPLVRLMQKA